MSAECDARFDQALGSPADLLALIDEYRSHELADDWGNVEACRADNTARAAFAAEALVAFARRTQSTLDNEQMSTVVSDLLGDLMHLCDAALVDFNEAMAYAQVHYRAERKGEF